MAKKLHKKLSLILVFALIFSVVLAGFQKGFVSAEGAEGGSANTVEKVTSSVASRKVEKGTKVELKCSTTGAAIHFTLDGTEPTKESDIYTEPITVNENLTIKGFAVKDEMNSSEISVFTYSINEGNTEEPTEISSVTANEPSGTVKIGTEIELSTKTEGAEIFYTLDKTAVTTESAIRYEGPIVIKDDTEIKALAYKEGNTSDVSEFSYKVTTVEAVKADVESGDVEKGTEIKLSSTTGAAIYFTIDGTEPTPESAIYLDPIKIDRDITIKAFSTMDGYKSSEVVEFKYTLKNSISVENICDVDKFKVGQLAEIKMLIGNNTAEKKDVTLLMASYDENNSMLNYVLVNENLGCRDRVELSGFMRVNGKCKVIRCFAIDSLDEMTPISNSVIVPVE